MDGYKQGGTPDVGWWSAQIRAGIKYRKNFAYEDNWPQWRSYYRGQFNRNVLPAHVMFKMARTIVPRTYFRNPQVSVQSSKPGMENLVFAHILNRVDNKMLRRMKVKQQAKRIVQNTFMFGTGFGKLGFGAQYTPVPEPVYTGKPHREKGPGTVEYNAFIQDNMPWFMSAHPGTIVVPAGVKTLAEAAWIAELHRRPLDDVKNDPRLKNTKGLTATSRSRTDFDFESEGSYKDKRIAASVDMIDLWEIRDKRTGKVLIIAPYKVGDKHLMFGDDILQHRRGVPYYDVVFNPDDEVFWGVPDARILEPLQREKSEIRTWQMFHRRMSMLKILYQENMIDEDQLTALLSGTPLAGVKVKGRPDMAVKILELSDIPEGLIKMNSFVDDDIREAMGMSRNQFGEYSQASARHSAFEAQVVQAASEIRIDERRDVMADMLVDMTEDLHHLMFSQWGNGEILVDVIGPMGVPYWVRFTPEMLKSGAYEVSVDPDSSVPETRDVREARATRAYELLKANPLIGPVQLTQYLLRELQGVEFDTMMKLPPNLGTQTNPMDVNQFGDVLGQFSNTVPGLSTSPANNDQVLDALAGGGVPSE